MASAHLHQPVLPSNPKSEDWRLFRRQFENYLLIVEADYAKKLPYLMRCIGGDGFTIYDGLPEPKMTYADALNRFNEFFKTRSSVLLRRKRFFEAMQELREIITEFSCRLCRLLGDCDFPPAFSSTLLRNIFVCGVQSGILGEKLLSEDSSTLTFRNGYCAKGSMGARTHGMTKSRSQPDWQFAAREATCTSGFGEDLSLVSQLAPRGKQLSMPSQGSHVSSLWKDWTLPNCVQVTYFLYFIACDLSADAYAACVRFWAAAFNFQAKPGMRQ